MTNPVKRIGKYEIEDTLGQGAMGIVYRARHVETGERVAIKTVFVSDKRKTLSIHREIRALARIRHPGVIGILEEGTEDGNPWFAMELVDGILLDTFCAREFWQISGFAPDWTSNVLSPVETVPDLTSPREKVTELFGETLDSNEWQDLPGSESAPRPGVPKPIEGEKPPAAGGKLPEILNLALRICAPLEFLHGEGIVHRDLKPSNIMIRTDGSPVIIDFGLMTEFWGERGRDAFDSLPTSGGTLNYIPPEQIMGDTVDARADLYSFGCILYELVTGQTPFIADSFLKASQAHLHLTPVPPSHIVDGVPDELNTLILTLLSKKPENRIGHAGGAAKVLMDLGATDPEISSYPQPKSYLYRPGFTGRQTVMEEMVEYLTRMKSGSGGGVILIGGEGGIGKTRLLTEFGKVAFQSNIRLYFGECLPEEGSRGEKSRISSVPFGALKKLFIELIAYCRKAGKEETDRILGAKARILLPYFPDLAELPGIDTYPEPEELPPESARFRLFQVMAQTLATSIMKKRTVIFLDDLHWADHLTSNFLLFLDQSRALAGMPVLILGTYRPEEITPDLERLTRIPRVKTIPLNRLDEHDVKILVSDMLALQNPSDVFASFLNSLSEGNPYFVAEYLRACVDEKLIYRDPRGTWQTTGEEDKQVSIDVLRSLPLPGSLKSLVERRLSNISGAARTLLDAASIAGREFDPLILWHNVPFSPDMLDAMDILVNHQILEEVTSGKIRFSQDILQQISYHQIEPDIRKQLHKQTAESYESIYSEHIEEYFAVIAGHWDRADCPDQARYYYLKAGNKALKTYSHENAEQAFRSYLNLVVSQNEESLQVRIDLAEKILLIQGRLEEGFQEIERALDDSRSAGHRNFEAESLMGISLYHIMKGNHESAISNSGIALEIFKEIHDRGGEANCYSRLITVYLREMALEKAEELMVKALKIYRDTGNRNGEAMMQAQYGTLNIKEGKREKAIKYFEKSLDIYKETGRRKGVAECLKNIGMLSWAGDENEKAVKMVSRALDEFREIGDRKQEGIALVNMAVIHSHSDNLDEGARFYEMALRVQREIGDRYIEGLTMKTYGKLLCKQGKVDQAQDVFKSALDILKTLGSPADKLEIYLNFARLERQASGDYSRAEYFLKKALSISELINNKHWWINCEIESVYLDLARKISCRDKIEAIENFVQENECDDDPDYTLMCDVLNQTERAFIAGQTLINGQREEDLSDGIKRWLESRK